MSRFFIYGLMLILSACSNESPDAITETAPESQAGSRLSMLLSSGDAERFETVLNERAFKFPEDHGPHDGYRNEWWYITGNLQDDTERRFGFELTFFRFALSPDELPEDASNWRSHYIMMGHLALTDVKEQQFYQYERFSRAAAGLAGAESESTQIWIDDWTMQFSDTEDNATHITINAFDETNGIQLNLSANKPPVLNGAAGLSQKSAEAGNASYYYSLTRLHSEGVLKINNQEFQVNGHSWLDREWSSSALSAEQLGWDWFALQLSDGTDLMIYQLRRNDGTIDAYSSGTLTYADGRYESLKRDDFMLEVLDYWQNAEGVRYPSKWQLRLPTKGLELTIEPLVADQEMLTLVRYWEGAVDVKGLHADQPVQGAGYVELTGYSAD